MDILTKIRTLLFFSTIENLRYFYNVTFIPFIICLLSLYFDKNRDNTNTEVYSMVW